MTGDDPFDALTPISAFADPPANLANIEDYRHHASKPRGPVIAGGGKGPSRLGRFFMASTLGGKAVPDRNCLSLA